MAQVVFGLFSCWFPGPDLVGEFLGRAPSDIAPEGLDKFLNRFFCIMAEAIKYRFFIRVCRRVDRAPRLFSDDELLRGMSATGRAGEIGQVWRALMRRRDGGWRTRPFSGR
jgi:hypothetical protein